MHFKTLTLAAGLLSLSAAAHAQVKSISVRADGVLCLSCVHRVEKALQRVNGVGKVHVDLDPVRAEVTPRKGAWLDPERLRDAIKNAGFRPGDVRCTVSGALAEWHGQPAIRLDGGDRMLVLQAAPSHPEVFTQVRQALASGSAPTVEVEGQYVGQTVANSPGAPAALRAERVKG